MHDYKINEKVSKCFVYVVVWSRIMYATMLIRGHRLCAMILWDPTMLELKLMIIKYMQNKYLLARG